VQLLLVRHGHAGSKSHWRGDDRLRPLSHQGLAEVEALTQLLLQFAPARIVSSPFHRCIQTVTPLAKELGLRIERTKRLNPSAGKEALSVLKLGSRKQNGAIILCTHGEVIHDLQEALSKDQHELFGKERLRDKGSVWILNRERGHIVSARYFPPLSKYADEA
jgi:phosphohistidine phosphatase SixA